MNRFVIDASAATEYLLRTSMGLKVETAIEEASLIAPELIDVEVLSVLRRAVRRHDISEDRALSAIEDLSDWSIDRIPHRTLVWLAWQHRNNISAYDAFYVAAARVSGSVLLTADGPLSRAPNLGISIQNVRLL